MGVGLVQADENANSVPFRTGKKRALLLPVKVADTTEANFKLETGLGFHVISPELAARLGLEPSPNHKVKTVTGNELNLARARISSLSLGNQKQSDLEVVVADPRLFVGNDGESKVDGILSLGFFRNRPFTLDFAGEKLVWENSESLSKRRAAGTQVECRFSDETSAASVRVWLAQRAPEQKSGGIAGFFGLGGGSPEPPAAWVQVDTGTENLLLNSKLMFTLKVDATGANVTETEPTDPSGMRYRSWASRLGKIEIPDRPALVQEKAPVIFRKLQVDGVLGQEFLSRYPAVTFDLPRNELVFAKPGP